MDYSFFSGLIQNVALLLVFSLLYATNWLDSTNSKKLTPKIFAGIVIGSIGCLLMYTRWTYQLEYQVDLRTILLSVAGLYLGGLPTLIAIAIMIVYRILLGGDYIYLGVILIVSSGLMGIGWKYFQQKKGIKNTIKTLYIFGLIVHLYMFLFPFAMTDRNFLDGIKIIALPVLIFYPIITVLLGLLMNNQLVNWQNRKAKEKLAESQQRWANMMRDINMFFINVDLDSNITFCNKYVYLITGYKEEEILGKSSIDIFIPKDRQEKTKEGINQFFQSDTDFNQSESKILTKDKKEIYVSWHNSVIIDSDGKVIGIASLGENITEKQAIFYKLKEAKEKAEESNHLKSVFLQNISHEIRTPMNAILGFISLLKDSNVDTKTREQFYGILEMSGERLLATVNNLIDISQVETQQIKVNKTYFSLSESLTHYLDGATPLAIKNNNKVICTSKYLKNEILLHTDKDILTGIFINLLSNALTFTKNGTIELGSMDEDGQIVFFIKDTGIGIPHNKLKVIFDRFVQADSSLSRPHEGSGLGLSIAQAYAKLLGGNLWVESEEGKGSTFFFNIPIQESTPSHYKTEPEIPEIFITSNLKILIAEDDKLNFLFLKKIIENIGITVMHAKNGAEAVEIVRNDAEIALVLMDIKMPLISGEEATLQIRKFNQTIPIIAQTAFAMPSDREKFIGIGCTDYISKPIKKNKLISLLKKYLTSGSE